MNDPRNKKLAEILVSHSLTVRAHEKIWIRVSSPLGLPLAREVFRGVLRAGGLPYLDIGDDLVAKSFVDIAEDHQLTAFPAIEKFVADWCDKSVVIVADNNTREMANADLLKLQARSKMLKPIRDVTLKKPWVLTYFPTAAMAQDANMGLEEFQDFFYKACIKDWNKESAKLHALAEKLNDAELIEVRGEKTNLRMSAKGRVFVPCAGSHNMPDGEVFTAPVDNSVEGTVYFNYPLLRQGKMIRDIFLRFEKGVVVEARASEHERFLHHILDTDAGARRLGEFAIGTNAGVRKYLNNVLFDEKMLGTVHMALGQAYEECNGVNKSIVHMDIVKDMTKRGSEVVADGTVILKEGKVIGINA